MEKGNDQHKYINLSSLNSQERKILMLLAEGHPHEEIAEKLGLKTGTITKYCARIYMSLGLTNMPDADKKNIISQLYKVPFEKNS